MTPNRANRRDPSNAATPETSTRPRTVVRFSLFEAAGSRRLRFLGRAVNVEERIGHAPDDNGEMRDVLLFRLRFEGEAVATQSPASTDPADAPARAARPFRDEPPTPPSAAPGERPTRGSSPPSASRPTKTITRSSARSTPSCKLSAATTSARYPARSTCGRPGLIFEAKTISAANELSQTCSGFAQLHECRMEYGTLGDDLCLVVDRPLSVRRQKPLDSLGDAVLVKSGADFEAGNNHDSHVIDALTEPGA